MSPRSAPARRGWRTKRCGRCGSGALRPTVYGLPDAELFEACERDEVELGGCIIEPDAPGWRCRRCGFVPGAPGGWTGVDGPRTGEFADHHRVLTSQDVPGGDAPEPTLLDFALTFDGYEAFGSELPATAGAARRAFERKNALPTNLAVLRSCLFFEQRAARHSGAPFGGPYVAALLEAIRTAAHREEVTA